MEPELDKDVNDHRCYLKALCRFCNQRSNPKNGPGTRQQRSVKKVTTYRHIIRQKLGIDVDQDDRSVHPPHLCHPCYCRVATRIAPEKAEASGSSTASWTPKNDWSGHKTAGACETCDLYRQAGRGGRPKKVKSGGRPKATPEWKLANLKKKVEDWLVDIVDVCSRFDVRDCERFLLCSVCDNVVSCPVETPCRHLVCADCLSLLFFKDSIECPACSAHVNFLDLSAPPHYVRLLLKELQVQCKHCRMSVHNTFANQHLCAPPTKSDHTYAKDGTCNLLSLEQRQEITRQFVRSCLAQSEDGLTAVINQNSGSCKPLVLRKVNSKYSEGPKPHIPADDLQELKEAFGFNWKQFRRLIRWLNRRGVTTAPEVEAEVRQMDAISGDLHSEMVPLQILSKDGKALEIKETPLVYAKDLSAKVVELLDQYEKKGKLIWHQGAIPREEVWLKLGGGRGGELGSRSFKLTLQTANLARPAGLAATQVVMLFPGSDSSFNLETVLPHVALQVGRLADLTWKGHKMRIFLSGDWEYLSKLYGLTGPRGRHPCLYCRASKQEMQSASCASPERSLDTMKVALQGFLGHGVARNAHNVIREPLLHVPLSQVCPPGLDISSGIFWKHYSAMLKKCHDLDLKLAKKLSESEVDEATMKRSFVQQIERRSLERRRDELSSEIANYIEDHTLLGLLLQPGDELDKASLEMAEKKAAEREELERTISGLSKLEFGAGPVASGLDKILQGLKVYRRSNSGRPFVFGQVHECLKEENIQLLTASIPSKVSELLPSDADLESEATEIASTFACLLGLYAKCHDVLCAGRFLNETDINQLSQHIGTYMGHFRQHFAEEGVSPRMHVLEVHVVPWLCRWGAPCGILGKGHEGGELLVHGQVSSIVHDLAGIEGALQLHHQSVVHQWMASNPGVYHKEC